jgi:hypothetical protein
MRYVCVTQGFNICWFVSAKSYLTFYGILCGELEFQNLHTSSTQLCFGKNSKNECLGELVLMPKNHSAEMYGVMELALPNQWMEVDNDRCNFSHYPF